MSGSTTPIKRVLDRTIAAVASQVTPRVVVDLAPLLSAELDKFRQEVHDNVSNLIRAEVNRQIDAGFEEAIYSRIKSLVEEVNSKQLTLLKNYLFEELRTTAKSIVNEEWIKGGEIRDHRNIRWYHSIELGNGIVTDGIKSAELLRAELARLKLSPEMLVGKRLLDIGCNDGFFSIECGRMGARVTALDGIVSDGMRFVRQTLKPNFDFYCIDMMSPSFSELGQFDIILYMGILYHTAFPFEQLVRILNACAADAILFVGNRVLQFTRFRNFSNHLL